jgi:hypothetical protein
MTKASVTVAACAALLWSGTVLATPTEQASLNTCQNAVKTATAAFVKNKVAAIGTCLQAISTQMVKDNAVDASGAAITCVTQFRKLYDPTHPGKSLPEKLTAGITAKCMPGGNNTHTLGDVLGVGATVSQPLNAQDLNAWCSKYGGDGSIDTLQEWTDCVGVAAECDVDSAIAAQYPRVLDWLVLVKPSMQALTPPGTDPNKITDAVAGLDAVKAEIDGPNNDNVVSLQCGGIVSSGTAAVGDVLTGKTFSNSTAGGLGGTMPNNGAANFTPGAAAVPVPAGFYSGGQVNTDASLVSGNIKSGATIFGVSGNSNVVNTSSGTAAAGNLLSGKTAWVAGAQVTGTMPNNGAANFTPGAAAVPVPAGFYSGGQVNTDASLVSGNIKSGATIFGVSGNSNVVNTSGATATATDMVSGKTAYVNGSLVTGTVTAGSNVNGANGLKTFTIPDGLYSGSKTATANDTNLAAANISSGVTILGVAGTALPAQRLKTGQIQCDQGAGTLGACPGSPAGQDGSLGKGLVRSYTDNGDGTVTDNKTGLMWEKLSQDGTIHEYSTTYTWYTAFTTKVATLNSGNFAGHNDWRLPNVNELQSIANYGTFNPAVDAAFNTSCTASCTVLTCSCTQSDFYWSATTYQPNPSDAWIVNFVDGNVLDGNKTTNFYVRAVRAGS